MSDPSIFEAVDTYIDSLFVREDDGLRAITERARAAGLPDIQLSPGQGKLLYLLARMIGARRVLELGTLAGYSTVWLLRAVGEDGKVTSIDIDPKHTAVAQESVVAAGFAQRCELLTGRALDLLPGLNGPYDLVFIDANKDGYPAYLRHAVRLLRPGGLLVADNVVRRGKVLTPSVDPQAIGAAAFNQALAEHDGLEAIILQQVGPKGHDGLALARKKD